MVRIVVPFRGLEAKTRLGLGPEFAQAMLDDVVAAAASSATCVVADADGRAGRGGRRRARATPADGPVLVVNADLPCVTRARPVRARSAACPPGGIALVEAADGTTNALALADAGSFAPCTARAAPLGSRRTRRAPRSSIPNLVDDVDTMDDLDRVAAARRAAHARRGAARSAGVKVALLAGGFGGARFARALSRRSASPAT